MNNSNNDKVVTFAADLIIYSVVAPIAIGGIVTIVKLTAKGISTMLYKKKIKKGLKDGSIVEIDGEYYEVKTEDPQ